MTSYVLNDEGRRLVEENMRLVPFALAKRFGSFVASNEDLVSVGNIGLCMAAAKFNPDRGVCFSTYATKCIINAVHTYSRSMHAAKQYNEQYNDGAPTASLNYILPSDSGDDIELIDLIVDEREDTERDAINKIMCDFVRPLVPTYNMIVNEHKTIGEIAKAEHKTRQGIHNRMQREFRRARDVLEGMGFTA